MSGTQAETEESGWTQENLQKLLAAMKTSIPANDRMTPYTKGLKTMNWDEVAFPPFSPEECQEKWRQIWQKMRKIRSLAELIDEAEDVISNPGKTSKLHPELPKRPCPPSAVFFEENCAKYLKKNPTMNRKMVFKKLMNKYKGLPDKKKAQYVEKFKVAMDEYKSRMKVFSKQYRKKTRYRERRSYQKKTALSADSSDGETEDEEAKPSKPPLNGYKLFCEEQCASMSAPSGSNYVNVWAQRWRDLTDRQREKYNTRSNDLKRLYLLKLDTMLKTFDEEKQQQILKENGIKRADVRRGLRKRVKVKAKFTGEPKIPPRRGTGFYCKKQMVLLKDKFPNSRDRFRKISQMWLELPDKEKRCYRMEVEEHMKTYSMELQTWFGKMSKEVQQLYLTHNPSKSQYLNVDHLDFSEKDTCAAVYRPSDSEDEAIEDSSSSSDEQLNNLDSDEVEEEEDHDAIMFEVF